LQNITDVDEKFSLAPERYVKQLLDEPTILFNQHRIAIMLELCQAGAVDFPQLIRDLGISDGALATHLKALIGEGLIESKRERVESRDRTTFIITKKGLSSVQSLFRTLYEIGQSLQ